MSHYSLSKALRTNLHVRYSSSLVVLKEILFCFAYENTILSEYSLIVKFD
jgi:hypothetical protein